MKATERAPEFTLAVNQLLLAVRQLVRAGYAEILLFPREDSRACVVFSAHLEPRRPTPTIPTRRTSRSTPRSTRPAASSCFRPAALPSGSTATWRFARPRRRDGRGATR